MDSCGNDAQITYTINDGLHKLSQVECGRRRETETERESECGRGKERES